MTKRHTWDSFMSMLSVRLPKELDDAMPKKERSAWVIAAIRDRLRRDRVGQIARSAAEHSERDLAVLAEWESAGAALPRAKPRKGKR